MRNIFFSFTTFMVVWVAGAIIFDLVLEFKSSMLMAGGVVTYWLADAASERVERYMRNRKKASR